MKRIWLAVVIVLAVFTTFAGIAVPNLLTAMKRSQQKRTLADMRSIATAWESRANVTGSYAVGSATVVTTADLTHALSPTYIRHMPQMDVWGDAFRFEVRDGGATYVITSFGSDGKPDVAAKDGVTTKFSEDIVYSNGEFTRYPEGML